MTTANQTILLVDDDEALLSLLSEYLEAEGFTVAIASRAKQAEQQLVQHPEIQLMVLDIMMPEESGLDLLKRLREHTSIPVIMLTGRGDDIDRILGLELGADDYLGKPCNPRELSARIKAILRRTNGTHTASEPNQTQLGELKIDSSRLKAYWRDTSIPLTGTEFRVLALLCQNIGQPISKETLTEQILNRKLSPYDRSMDVHVSRIRQKLSEFPDMAIHIQSIRGLGYQLSQEEAS